MSDRKKDVAECERLAEEHYRKFQEKNAFRDAHIDPDMSGWIKSHKNAWMLGWLNARDTLTAECERLQKELKELNYYKDHKSTMEEVVAENDRLKEIISHLPKVPTQPYEKEMAQEIERLKGELENYKTQGPTAKYVADINSENAQLKSEVERIKEELDDAVHCHKVSDEHRSAAMIENDQLRERVRELEEKLSEYELGSRGFP